MFPLYFRVRMARPGKRFEWLIVRYSSTNIIGCQVLDKCSWPCYNFRMKLLIAGGRIVNVLTDEIESLLSHYEITGITEIISGGASGVDTAAMIYAKDMGIPFVLFSADWSQFGKAAGHIRNREMADYADELLIIWDGKSRGSANMKKTMEKLKKPVHNFVI